MKGRFFFSRNGNNYTITIDKLVLYYKNGPAITSLKYQGIIDYLDWK